MLARIPCSNISSLIISLTGTPICSDSIRTDTGRSSSIFSMRFFSTCLFGCLNMIVRLVISSSACFLGGRLRPLGRRSSGSATSGSSAGAGLRTPRGVGGATGFTSTVAATVFGLGLLATFFAGLGFSFSAGACFGL
jgi:hypothetical protein